MKTKSILLSLCVIAFGSFTLKAQTDMTSKIVNPSFEDNSNDMATGWSYDGGADTLIWHVINTDGDATKDGNNICGLWHPRFADPDITQTITGLSNGTYRVTAGFMVGVNGATPGQRLTTQRIFANNNSVLYGAEGDYTAENIAVLTGTLSEAITYAGYPVSKVENGPFSVCTVETTVSDGTLKLGVKTNGVASQYGFSFPDADESGWGWFKVDNFTLTLMSGATAVDRKLLNNNFICTVKNGFLIVEGVEDFKVYDVSGNVIRADQQLKQGIYLVKTNTAVQKIFVK